jgi:threonine/homoserine/homoserine lactone efflux protein
MMSIEFFITSLIVVLAPGTGVIYTVATGLARGGLVSIAAAFGCTLGILPHITAAVFGLAALLHASALAFQVVKIAGVLYLLFMAWSILRDKGTLSVDERIDARSFGKVIVRGFLINILNPKLSIFFLAFLPQFIPADTSTVTGSMITLGGIFMLMTFMVFIGYGIFAATVRRHIIDKPKVMAWSRRIFAGTFVALGAKLAFAER